MDWTRSDVLALAAPSCTFCRGLGMKTGRAKGNPCNCVLREIFRVCYARFRYCADPDSKGIGHVTLDANKARSRKNIWSRKDEEYVADFCIIAKRALSDFEHRVFRYHFLFGADWRLCCRRLDIDRGNFYHAVYRIEKKLGRAFRELEPYGLFPVDEYFGGTRGAEYPEPLQPIESRVLPIRPPLRKPLQPGNVLRGELLEVA